MRLPQQSKLTRLITKVRKFLKRHLTTHKTHSEQLQDMKKSLIRPFTTHKTIPEQLRDMKKFWKKNLKFYLVPGLIVPITVILVLNGSTIWNAIREPLLSTLSSILTLNDPVRLENIRAEDAFKYNDTPEFQLHTPQRSEENIGQTYKGEYKNKNEEITANIVHKGYKYKYPANITKTAAGKFNVSFEKPRSFVPGDYALEVSSKESLLYTRHVTQDFSWGVLAINTQKSIYTPQEVAHLQIGVVDELGHTICDAGLNLKITDPLGQITILSSENGTIHQSGYCHGDSYVPVADYLADYKTGGTGIYKMELQAKTKNGYSRNLKDQFEVRDSVPFEIERTSFPSRIYPPVEYPVLLSVTANQDYSGEIADFTPVEFEIDCQKDIPLPEGIKKGSDKDYNLSRNYCNTNEVELTNKITWTVSLKKGQTARLFYIIKFPPISPEFYLMGPAKIYARGYDTSPATIEQIGPDKFKSSTIMTAKMDVIFEEARLWQIASDATISTEQQINIISQTYTTTNRTDSPTDNSLGLVYYSESVYNPIPVTYFEADLKNSSDGITTATLYNSSGQPVANSSVSVSGMNYQRVRSNRINLAPGEYTVRLKSSNGSTASMTAARIIAVQNTFSSFNKTETQIEVGSNETSVNTTMTALTSPKIYKYDDGQWSPRPDAYFEATLKSPGISSSVTTPGTGTATCANRAIGAQVDWTNPTNAQADEGTNFAVVSLDGTTSDYLYCNSLDFNISGTATIVGIQVDIDRRASDAGEHRDAEVKLVDETNTVRTTNKADTGTFYPTGETRATYGSSTDTWGETAGFWTPTIVNDADFGAVLSTVDTSSAGGADTSSVDVIIVTVYFTDTQTVTAELYNRTDSTVVTGSSISIDSSTNPNWIRVRGASALSTNWDTTNDDEYEVRLKTSDAGGPAYISNAKIVLQQSGSNITKMETYHNYINNQQSHYGSGNIGTFSTSGQGQLPITNERFYSTSATVGPSTYLYVLGGVNASRQSTVYKSTLNNISGDAGTFSTSGQTQYPALTSHQTAHTATIGASTYLYSLGGFQGVANISTVYRATINPSGDVGAISTSSQAQLPIQVRSHASAQTTIGPSTYVYVTGGFSATAVSTVYKSIINSSNGNLLTFQTSTQAQLPDQINAHSHAVATANGTTYIYTLGGSNNAAVTQSTVYKSQLNSSGDVLSFSTTGQGQLPIVILLQSSTAATIGSSTYVYTIGGSNGSVDQSTIYRSVVNSTTGDLGTFSTTNMGQNPLQIQAHTANIATIGNSTYLYTIAGRNVAVFSSAVYKASLSPDTQTSGFNNLYDPNNWQGGTFTYYHETTLKPAGTTLTATVRLTPEQLATISSNGIKSGDIGTFNTTSQSQLPQLRKSLTTNIYTVGASTYLYSIGGYNSDGIGTYSTVYKATFDSASGNIGTMNTTSQAQLPDLIKEHTVNINTIGSSSYLYLIGGSPDFNIPTSTIYKSTINTSNGNIGTFSTSSQSQLPVQASVHTTNTFELGSSTYMYVIGGSVFGSPFLHSTVFKATINSSNGNLGTFNTSSQSQLPDRISGHSTVFQSFGSSTYIYLIGGNNIPGSLSTVYRSTMNSSTGDLGSFATTSQSQLPEQVSALEGMTQTIGSSTYLYIIGGNNKSTVYKATIDSGNGNVGTFTTTNQIQLPEMRHSMGVNLQTFGASTYIYVSGGESSGIFHSSVYRALINNGDFELIRSSSFSPDSDPGRIGTFSSTSQSQLPETSSGNTAVTANVNGINYIYSIGGNASTVYRSDINASSNISAFATTSQAQLTRALSYLTAHNFKNSLNANYVFTIGGKFGSDSAGNNIGTLSTTSQAQLPAVKSRHSVNTSTVGNSTYIYVIGGFSSSTLYKATLDNANGNTGAFATTSQAQLPTFRAGHTSHISTSGTSTYVYVIGGPDSSVYKATINSTNGNIGTLATTSQSQLRIGLEDHTSDIITAGASTYIYVVGGLNSPTTQSTVYKATINSTNGNIGTFDTTSQSQLPEITYGHISVVHTTGSSSYIYILGGNHIASSSTVYRATVNSDNGNIGAFATTSQAQLPELKDALKANILSVGNSTYVYIIGAGSNGSTLYRATIDSDSGNMGAFSTTSQAQLPTNLLWTSATINTFGASTYLYLLGGYYGGTEYSTVYKANIDEGNVVLDVSRSQIDTSANIGGFATTSQSQLPQGRRNHTSTIITHPNNYLYVLGGCNTLACSANDSVSTVYKATIDIPATTGTFSTSSQGQLPLTVSRGVSVFQTIGASTYVYTLGGTGGTSRSTVYKSVINSTSGDIMLFTTTSQAQLPAITITHTANSQTVGSSSYLYLLGGQVSGIVSTVYKSTLNSSTGDVGLFSTSSQAQLPSPLADHVSLQYTFGSSTYTYIVGGYTGTAFISTVYKSTIDSSGNLGTFLTTSQSQFPQNINDHTAVIHPVGSSTYLYVLGGSDSATQSTVYRATINPSSGDIGAFNTSGQGQLPAIRQNLTSIATSVGASTYIFAIGGLESGERSTVYRATIDAGGNVGTFSTSNQSQLPDVIRYMSTPAFTVGSSTYFYAIGGVNGAAHLSTVYKGALDTNPSIQTFATTSQAQLPKRLRSLSSASFTIPNGTSYIYTIGGIDNADAVSSTLYRSTVDTSGNLGTFATTDQSQLPQALQLQQVVTTKVGETGVLYIIGGCNTSTCSSSGRSTVYRASINSTTGNIGTFATSGQAQLPQVLNSFSSVPLVSGASTYLYILGGDNGGNQSTVYKSTITSSDYDSQFQNAIVSNSWLVVTATLPINTNSQVTIKGGTVIKGGTKIGR